MSGLTKIFNFQAHLPFQRQVLFAHCVLAEHGQSFGFKTAATQLDTETGDVGGGGGGGDRRQNHFDFRGRKNMRYKAMRTRNTIK